MDPRLAQEQLLRAFSAALTPLCEPRAELLDFLAELPPRLDDGDALSVLSCDERGLWLHRSHPDIRALLDAPPSEERVANLAETARAALEKLIPPPDPREELVGALRGALESICQERSEVLTHVDLQAVDYRGAGGDQAVTCDRDGVHLHPAHPAVDHALAQVPPDPMLVLFLASALYTAVNIYLVEVTDEDEDIFHRLVADYLLRNPA